jgi:hypothetical protein
MKVAAGLLAAAAALFVFVLIARPWSPKPYHGQGTVSSYLWCLGFSPEGGGVIPISNWPAGLRAEGYSGVLLDSSGTVVLRRGDRITFDGTLRESDGDTPCANTQVITVERFERGPGPSD